MNKQEVDTALRLTEKTSVKVATESIKTSTPTIRNKRSFQQWVFSTQSGMTLIEIMVVVLIIGALTALVAPALVNPENEVRAILRNFSALTKEIHSQARLQNKTFRLVIDMEAPDKKPNSFYVESSTSTTLLKSAEQREEEERKKTGSADSDAPPPSDFSVDTTVMKKPKELPKILKFEDVELQGEDAPITEGKVYIHFFPQGLVQEAVIHLANVKEGRWSIRIHPLTGESQLFTEHKPLKDFSE